MIFPEGEDVLLAQPAISIAAKHNDATMYRVIAGHHSE
jgi:hypothetical protein